MNRAPNVFELHLRELIARGGYDENDPPIYEALAYARAHPEEASQLLAVVSLHTALSSGATSSVQAFVPPRSRPAPKGRTGRPRPAPAGPAKRPTDVLDSPEQRRVRQAFADTQVERREAVDRARMDARNQARKDARAKARADRPASPEAEVRAEAPVQEVLP